MLLSPKSPQSEPLHIGTHVHTLTHQPDSEVPSQLHLAMTSHALFRSLIRSSQTHTFVNPSALKDTQQAAFTKSFFVKCFNFL